MRAVSDLRFKLGMLVALGFLAVGCATPPPATDAAAVAEYNETNDPLEPTNRVMYEINDGLDTVIMRPLAQGYRAVVPEPVRQGVHNLLTNIGTPVVFANDVLQNKPQRAGDSFMRFLINTTVGVGGIFDVAKELGYPYHDNGFGTTLALWGANEGPFLFLPVLGPSNPRDFAGFGVDMVTDPWFWVGNGGLGKKIFDWSRTGLSALDMRSRYLDDVDNIKKTALDPYATFRSLYRQRRNAEIDAARQDYRGTVIGSGAAEPAARGGVNRGLGAASEMQPAPAAAPAAK
jgi:phospholipid-binding lipoprotein MlaA